MARKFLRRLSARFRGNQAPDAWYVRPFAALLAHPVYFSINRRSVVRGLSLGLFIAVLPIIGHTPLVIGLGLLLRANLPVAALTIWIANPLTYGPILYLEYQLGALLLSEPGPDFSLDLPMGELTGLLFAAWRPIWAGAIAAGVMLAVLGYLAGNGGWHLMTRLKMRRRRETRAQPGVRNPR